MFKRLRTIALQPATGPIEMYLSLVSFVSGFTFLFPVDTSTSRYWATFEIILPIPVWGCLMIAQGVFQLLALGLYSRGGRQAACISGFMLWGFLAFLFILTQPASPATAVFSLRAICQLWGFWRIPI